MHLVHSGPDHIINKTWELLVPGNYWTLLAKVLRLT